MTTTAQMTVPNERGRFGPYGGRFAAETLMPLLLALGDEYDRAKADPEFAKELGSYLKDFVGRPTPTYFAQRLSEKLGGAISSARICVIPEPIRSTTQWDRFCSRGGWAKPGSSLRPEPDNMA